MFYLNNMCLNIFLEIFYIDFITMLNKLKHNYKYWIVANNYCRTIESRLQNKCENYLVKVIIYYFISTKI